MSFFNWLRKDGCLKSISVGVQGICKKVGRAPKQAPSKITLAYPPKRILLLATTHQAKLHMYILEKPPNLLIIFPLIINVK